MRITYKIKGRRLALQFYIIVIPSFVAICCVYAVSRMTRWGETLEKPSFGRTALDIAVALREISPANRDNVVINISLPSRHLAGGIIADDALSFLSKQARPLSQKGGFLVG